MASNLQESIKTALEFMPEHRLHRKRTWALTLDTLLDDARSQKEVSAGTLDLILMGYRYTHLFQRELGEFLKKPNLEPRELKDLFQVVFAALLTRTKTPISTLVSEAVEVARWQFGAKTAGLSNAFFRGVTRRLEALKDEVELRPQILLGPRLLQRWGENSNAAKKTGQLISLRPEGGLSAFDDKGQFFESISMLDFLAAKTRGEKIQAMDLGSWGFAKWCHGKILKQHQKSPTNSSGAWSLLDACAAPGGKLIAALTLLNIDKNQLTLPEKVIATDAKNSRLSLLRENLEQWKLNELVQVEAISWGEAASSPASSQAIEGRGRIPEHFDWVIADLPCSGLGTLHSRPDIISEDPGKRVDEVKPLQAAIIQELRQRLNDANSILIISVCSVDPQEIANISAQLDGQSPEYSSWENADAKSCEGITAWVFRKTKPQ